MTNQSTNPLSQHFRTPAIHFSLPSEGKWWPEGTIDIPATGQLPIYPMTARDEIAMKTPDALLNGSATVDTIKSCVPNINDPWSMPGVDIDALMIAIRIASYGPNLDIATTCPECNELDDVTIDLGILADSISPANASDIVKVNGLTIQLKPYDYRFIQTHKQKQFEEQRLINQITDSDLTEEEKIAHFTKSFKSLANHTLESITLAIKSITTNTGEVVTDSQYINEFIDNCEREIYQTIRKEIVKFGEQSAYAPIKHTCSKCNHKYDADVLFDQSDFFE